ncbi:hypothetical protein M8C21_007515, partial [Ambrosia artemisiifolia]
KGRFLLWSDLERFLHLLYTRRFPCLIIFLHFVLCNCVKTMVIRTWSGKRQHVELSAAGALVCLTHPYRCRVIYTRFKAIKKRKRNFEINSDSDVDNVDDSEVAGSKLKSRPTQSWKSLSFADEDDAETSKTLETPTKRIMDVVTELGERYGIRAVSNVSVDVEDSGGENEWFLTRVGPVGKCYGGQPENDQSVPLTGIPSNMFAGVSKQSDPVPVDDAPNTKASKNVAMNTESAVPTSLGLGLKQAFVPVVQWCGEIQNTLAGAMGTHRMKLGLASSLWKPDAGSPGEVKNTTTQWRKIWSSMWRRMWQVKSCQLLAPQ